MLSIQNQKTLGRKKYRCDAKDVKSKTKTAIPVKFARAEDQQRETVHKALQAKDAKILTITSTTTSTICLRQHQQQCTKHVPT